uniref:Uncharacterized protein n=1 Tax=Acrobeloides nanus TaxID=290746 RepID=A0A914CKZ9_9BILA
MKPNPKVFIALKNGDLVKAITEIEPSQLKPFMPVLMLGAFQHTSTRSPALDEICSKLIDYQSGNQLLQLMKLDYAQIQYKCVQTNAEVKRLETKNFHQLNLDEKLLHVCLHIVSQVRKWNILTSLPNYSDSFDPFDVEYCHEEVTWLVTMASFFMPEIFELKQFVAALLPYVHGPKLISYFVANQPHTSDSVIQTIMAVKCPDEDGYLAKQRNEAIIYLLEMDDKSSMHRFINETLETSSHLYIIVSILCSEIVDEENFVRLMAPCLTRKDGKLVSFLSKTGNRTTLKRLIDRINGILDRNPTSKMNEELVILIALFCSLFTIRLTPEESLKWLLFLTNQTQPSEDLLKTTLCTILACPQLINYSPVSKEESSIAEHHLANYFQWIRELIKREPEKFDSLNQLILLITVHFNSNKNDELVALFSSVLGFQ